MFKMNVRKNYEVMFTGEHYAIVRAIIETMGLKAKQYRGNMFRGKFVGVCRVGFKASEEEFENLMKKLNKYGVKEAVIWNPI